MQDVKVSAKTAAADPTRPSARFGPDSVFWLFLVSLLFLLAEVSHGLLHMPLGADEITYIARTSVHQSGVMLPPVHGQGAGLLAAPVTLLTTALVDVRLWMALLSAAGLFLSLLCWRGLRPGWVLALAGLILASMAITQNSGVQIYPDWWSALGLLALTGLFLQAMRGLARQGLILTLIGFASFVIVVMRPQNIIFVMGPTIAAALVVRDWRKPKVLAAMAAGIVLGLVEWVIGAYLWFGGLTNRIHLAGQEPPSLGLHFSFFRQVKVLSGPWYCQVSIQCKNWNMPGETAWWIALLGFAILGVYVVRHRAERRSSLLAAFSGLWVLVFYSFLVPFGAPRYILPTWALFSILAADAIAWLCTKSRWRTVGIVASCLFVLTGVVTQRIVLNREVAAQTASRPYAKYGHDIVRLGIRPPCVMNSAFVGYYVGCSGPWTGQTVDQLLAHPPPGSNGWRLLRLRHLKPGVSFRIWVPRS
jgi:hypothetical protein